MAEIDCGEADRERESRHNFEVDETLDAHATDTLKVAVAGNSGDQRRQNQGCDDGLDKAEKYVAEDTQIDGDSGSDEAQLCARYHRDDYIRREGPAMQSIHSQEPTQTPS